MACTNGTRKAAAVGAMEMTDAPNKNTAEERPHAICRATVEKTRGNAQMLRLTVPIAFSKGLSMMFSIGTAVLS